MRSLRVGMDLDGVIYRWGDTVRYLLKTFWGLENIPLEGRIENKIPAEANTWIWKEGIENHGLFRYGSIYKGSREFLDRISHFCDIVVITRRPPNAIQDTLDWLAYQKFPASEIHILGWKDKKSAIKCDAYVDDETSNAQDYLANTDGIVIMPDKEWNQERIWSLRFHRTHSWEEIERVLRVEHEQINREK